MIGVGELRRIAESQGLAMNQLAIAWLLARDAASTLVLGGSRPEHFTSVYEVADATLPEGMVARIDERTAALRFGPHLNQPFEAGGAVNPNG